jgi:RNA polymerase sigma-70 factor (ECF subfamily)
LREPTGDPIQLFEVARRVREARRGEQDAYAFLYRRFAPLVHGILLGRFRPALADEATQECFALAFARLAQLNEDHKFGAWIATIARRMPAAATREQSAGEWFDPVSAAASPEDRADAARVLRALVTLPPAYRETLTLRLVEGLGGPEIADLTGLTPESVRVNLHRGMAKLRVALGLQRADIAEVRNA